MGLCWLSPWLSHGLSHRLSGPNWVLLFSFWISSTFKSAIASLAPVKRSLSSYIIWMFLPLRLSDREAVTPSSPEFSDSSIDVEASWEGGWCSESKDNQSCPRSTSSGSISSLSQNASDPISESDKSWSNRETLSLFSFDAVAFASPVFVLRLVISF